MNNSNRSDGGKDSRTDEPTQRFPALQKALEKAFEPMTPAWPTTDQDD